MRISVLKKKARKYHKYIGFTFSFFILYLVVTGILLLYPINTGIKNKYIDNKVILEKYNLSTIEDVNVINNNENKANQIIIINNRSIYFQNKYIDSTEHRVFAGIYLEYKKVIYLLSKKKIIIYSFEEHSEKLELKDIKFYNVLSFTNSRGEVTNEILFKNKDNVNFYFSEDFSDSDKLFIKKLRWQEPIAAKTNTAETYLKIHQGDGVSLHRIITELHNGQFFGNPLIFALFLSSLSLIFLVVSSFLFGINYKRKKK